MRASEAAAFAVRFRGRVRAFLNRCGHLPVELDWEEGRFFDASGLYLICATHGALYAILLAMPAVTGMRCGTKESFTSRPAAMPTPR